MNMDAFKNDLRAALLNAKTSLQRFRRDITNKNVVIFLGNTRSGKSSLINYVIGTHLEAFKERRSSYKIRKVDESANGPSIGQGTTSSTVVPTVNYHQANSNLVLIDMPGFGDTRGSVQDIINSIYMNHIKYAKMCKFVLVSDINDFIHDNVAGLIAMIENVNKLIPGIEKLIGSSALIITKEYDDYSRDEVSGILKEKLSGLNIDRHQLQLINYFIHYNQAIGVFRMPTQEGNLTLDVNDNIHNAISLAKYFEMHRNVVDIPLGTEARLVLLEIYDSFLDNMSFSETLKKLTTNYKEYFEIDSYVFASLDEELINVKVYLENLSRKICSVQTLPSHNVIDVLKTLEILGCINESNNLYQTLNLFIMLDEVLMIEESFKIKLTQKYKSELSEFVHKITELAENINEEMQIRGKLTLKFASASAMCGSSAGVSTIGAVALRSLSLGSLATGAVGAVTGIGAVCAAAYAVSSISSYNAKNEALENRKQIRILQGRNFS